MRRRAASVVAHGVSRAIWRFAISIRRMIPALMQAIRLDWTTALRVTLIGASIYALAEWDPATTAWFPSCPFYAITGWQCPLCGSLRAVHAVLHGAPLAAVTFNPLTIIYLAMWLVARDRTTRFCFSGYGLSLLIGFGLLRNL
jgi:hypothetical protein